VQQPLAPHSVPPLSRHFEQLLTHLPNAFPPPGLMPRLRQYAGHVPAAWAQEFLDSPSEAANAPRKPEPNRHSIDRRDCSPASILVISSNFSSIGFSILKSTP